MHITYNQNKVLHALLGSTGLMHVKQDLVYSFSYQRTTSSSELLVDEATALIKHLQSLSTDAETLNKMRRKIIAKAHNMRWELANGKADMQRINQWCVRYGGFNKTLNAHTITELTKLVTQFNNMYKKFLQK